MKKTFNDKYFLDNNCELLYSCTRKNFFEFDWRMIILDEHEVKRIIFECVKDDAFVSLLKVKLFNMEGLKSQADYDEQVNRVNELESQKKNFDTTIEELKEKITEIEGLNEDLKLKLEQVQSQYNNDELKLEQYRTDMKNYLSQVEEQESTISNLENENKKLQSQLTEAEENFKTASAESIKNLQEIKKLEEKLKPKKSAKK